MSLATGAYNLLVTRLTSLIGITAANIVRVSTLNALTIEQRIRDGNVTLPCLLLFVTNDQEADWGMAVRAWTTHISIGYITLVDAVDEMDTIETACETIKNGLYGYQESSGGNVLQILEEPIKNTDSLNSFNEVCMRLANGMVAGEVRCKVLYGDIP